MMETADQNRDAAYATADDTYNTNSSADYADYDSAVNGPGGIEETWQGEIDTADATYNAAVDGAMSAYDAVVQAAQATLDSDIAAAQQKFDDWLNGNQAGQTISGSFTRTKTTDTSTTPATVTWETASRVEWSPTEGTGTQSEFKKEPPIPAGYIWISTTSTTSGSITTVTDTYGAPAGGIGGGSAAPNNPWELAKIARTEFYIEELNGYYDQYIVAIDAAYLAYDGAVDSANAGYNTTLYGDPTGMTTAPGSPADGFNNALTGAAAAFDSGEQTAMSTYNTNMDGYWMAEMQYWEDMMNGLPGTPPDPDAPAQFAKDYYVDTTALDINYAVAVGAAWTGWVGAQVAADTTRDNAIINAEYQLGVDSANAGNDLVTSQIGAEDSYAKDIIDIDADYAIAVTEKSADVAGEIADAELNFELTENTAGQLAGKAINAAEKDRTDDYADADETYAEALSLEEEDLANDLAAEEETRQNSYASADADWLSDEAAANIASTTIAAAATSTFLTDAVGAEVGYTNTVAPLITSATQAFNNDVDSAYAAAFPGDPDQAAVSAAWTAYYNAMATAAENAITAEASAYQGYIGSIAGDIETTMNNVAGESTQLATDYGNALTNYVSTVGAAATLATSQTAAAGVTWVDSVATDVANSIKSAAGGWKQMADDGVDAAKDLADDYSNLWNGFVHSYLAAAVPHETAVINEDRQAAKDTDSELTILAQGVAAEQHDLNLDDLSEWQSAALQLSPLDDPVIIADAQLQVDQATLEAWIAHTDTQSAPVTDFANSSPGGTGPSVAASFAASFGESTNTASSTTTVSGMTIDEFMAPLQESPLFGIAGIVTSAWNGVIDYMSSRTNVLGQLIAGDIFGNQIWGDPGLYISGTVPIPLTPLDAGTGFELVYDWGNDGTPGTGWNFYWYPQVGVSTGSGPSGGFGGMQVYNFSPSEYTGPFVNGNTGVSVGGYGGPNIGYSAVPNDWVNMWNGDPNESPYSIYGGWQWGGTGPNAGAYYQHYFWLNPE